MSQASAPLRLSVGQEGLQDTTEPSNDELREEMQRAGARSNSRAREAAKLMGQLWGHRCRE